MNQSEPLPLGKLPPELLAQLLSQAPVHDRRVLLGPGIGLDCAVVDAGASLFVYKSEPITFVTENIGWYGVQVSANDIATTGAVPRWYMATLLLPENKTRPEDVERIGGQLFSACEAMNISLIGGHTEITHGLDRPILCGTMIGEVAREGLITPRGAQAGDRLLLTKGVPIEATAILAGEFSNRLTGVLNAVELQQAQNFLYDPGIGVLRDAQIALRTGKVHAMHDPTEGGLAGALWELAEASRCSLVVDPGTVPVPLLARKICNALELNPFCAIASGALLLAVPPGDARLIRLALRDEGIACAEIGWVEYGLPAVWQIDEKGREPFIRPERDEIARLF